MLNLSSSVRDPKRASPFQAETNHRAVAATDDSRAFRPSKSLITSWGHLSEEALAPG